MRVKCYHKVVLIKWFDIIDKEMCATKRANLMDKFKDVQNR